MKIFNLTGNFFYLFIFLFAAGVFLLHYGLIGQAVYGDGIGYYAHLHSWVIDGDWDYTNEYKHLYDHQHNNTAGPSQGQNVQIVATTRDGKAQNFYGPGTAILLLPFYITAHAATTIVNFLGGNLSAQGYGDWYQIPTGLGAVFYIILGLYLLEQTIQIFTHDETVSRLSMATIFLATSLLYYGSFDVINSHFASFFLAAFFFYLFFKRPVPRYKDFWLGLVTGLLTINRPQDGAVILIWLMGDKRNVRAYLTGLIPTIVLLLIQWRLVFDNPWQHPYLQALFNHLRNRGAIDVLGSLFHPVTGLFMRTPLLLVLFIFFGYLFKKKEVRGLVYPFSFFVTQFFIVTIQGGWSAAAYGGRMYISSLIFFGLVLGKLLGEIKKRRLLKVYLFVSVFIVINIFSMGYFIAVEKGTEQRTLQRMNSLINHLK